MATRKKSINDIEAQLERIRTMALSRGANQPDEIAIPLYKRYRRALKAANNYKRNIAAKKSFKNTANKDIFTGVDEAKGRKYSPNTYRGLNKG